MGRISFSRGSPLQDGSFWPGEGKFETAIGTNMSFSTNDTEKLRQKAFVRLSHHVIDLDSTCFSAGEEGDDASFEGDGLYFW